MFRQYTPFCLVFLFLRAAPFCHAQASPPNSMFPKAQTPAPGKVLVWQFPLTRPHTGILLGNGTQGLMVWGGGGQLNITIGRAGFWDHRGGNEFSARTTYREVKKLLEAKDEAGLRKVFEVPPAAVSQPKEPRQLGGGRLEIKLPDGWTLAQGRLLLQNARIQIVAKDKTGREKMLLIGQSVDSETAWVQMPPEFAAKAVLKLVPAYESESVKKALEQTGVPPPTFSTVGQDYLNTVVYQDFTQHLPADEPLTIGYQLDKLSKRPHQLLVASHLGKNGTARVRAGFEKADVPALEQRNARWWADYWAAVPEIRVPDPVLQEIADYGLYKQACTTPPQGVAAALQGPFMEDYQLPPWSNDYHSTLTSR